MEQEQPRINPRRRYTNGEDSNHNSSRVRPPARRSNSSESNRNDDNVSYQRAMQSRNKYIELAKDAARTGDKVDAERYYQHADHYSRVINSLKLYHRKEQD